MQELMLGKKTQGFVLPRRVRVGRRGSWLWMGVAAAVVMAGGLVAQAQSSSTSGAPGATVQQGQPEAQPPLRKGRFGAVVPVTYDNRFEAYGGINLMTFQAGQDLPKRMNLGGGEALMTWWLTPRLGVGGEWRGEWGTTPVKPNPFFQGRALVSLQMGLGGVQWRGPKNQYAALNYHAYAGMASGKFDHSTGGVPAVYLPQVGLYSNKTAFVSAIGGSVDINRSKNWAVRISPDLMIETFGTETREFFAISGGVLYRFGKR